MKVFVSLILLACLSGAVAPPPNGPDVGPRSLVITRGGTYSGTFTTINITATDGTPIIIDRAKLVGPGDLITQNVPADLTVTNCTGSTTSPGKFLVVWRFTRLNVQHNAIQGTGGMLISDFAKTGKALKILYNRAENITGATSAISRQKVSFIQLYRVHVPDAEVAWNQVRNVRGRSAVEDNISWLLSGGTPGHPALTHDNFVDGAFAWPSGVAFTGCGIMCFDPGKSVDVTMGGYARVYANQVVASENQGYACAGGHDIEIVNNRAVNDGSTSKAPSQGFKIWNWQARTPASVFGENVSAHDNFSYWIAGDEAHRKDWEINLPAQSTANTTGKTASEEAERKLWSAKCAAAKACIGPLPADEDHASRK